MWLYCPKIVKLKQQLCITAPPISCNPPRTRGVWTPECSAVKSPTCTHQRTSACLQFNSSLVTLCHYTTAISISSISLSLLSCTIVKRFVLSEKEMIDASFKVLPPLSPPVRTKFAAHCFLETYFITVTNT